MHHLHLSLSLPVEHLHDLLGVPCALASTVTGFTTASTMTVQFYSPREERLRALNLST